VVDIFFVIISFFLSAFLIKDVNTALDFVKNNLMLIFINNIMFLGILYIANAYRTMWVYSGTKNYLQLEICLLIVCIASIVVKLLFFSDVDIKISILANIIASTEIIASRMAVRGFYNLYKIHTTSSTNKTRLLIVGAGDAAAMILRDLIGNKSLKYEVVGLIDDDSKKQNANVNGIEVLGNRHDIPKICNQYKIQEILIAMPSAIPKDRKDIIEICNNTDCSIKILPSMEDIIDYNHMHDSIRDIQIEDLLARDPIVLSNDEINGYIRNKTVLVTGGGGSIGSELCRQIMRFNPSKLIILDIYENNAYDLQMELNRKYPDNKPETVIASVRDMERLEDIFKEYKPYIVFHAAAHKHVPLMEASPGEAIKNNVFGTMNVVKCSDKYNVKRFVMISTDKAVNPTNVMGATKRICEMIVQCMQHNSKTEFVAVRFGNVLGSNGSVIPLFKKQIQEGGPVTVTHKEITRFFMTIPEAAQLVLQAASYAKGGEIFVLNMGEPVKIYDLAKNLIKLSGYKPDKDIKIEVVGLRPGEKLYEELLMDEEGLTETGHNKIFIGKPIDIKKEELDCILKNLYKAVKSNDIEKIKDAIEECVPTYIRNPDIVNKSAV